MDEAEIRSGRERMRVLCRYRALRRHAGMAERMRAGSAWKIKALRDRVRHPDILEHLDALAETECAELGVVAGEPGEELVFVAAKGEDRMAAVMPGRAWEGERRAELAFEHRPIEF